MNPFFHTDFSISDSLKNVRKNVLIYETIIMTFEDIDPKEIQDVEKLNFDVKKSKP